MAKQQKPIVRFDGGHQTGLNQRDIPDEALAFANNVSVNIPGVLKLAGKFKEISPEVSIEDDMVCSYTFGYGLYSFHADFGIDVSLATESTAAIVDSAVSGYAGTFNVEGEYDFVQLDFTTNHGLSVGDRVTITGTGGTYNGSYNTRPTATQYNGNFQVVKVIDADQLIIDATSSSDGLSYNVAATVTRSFSQSQFVHEIIQNNEKFHIYSKDKINVENSAINLNHISLDTADNTVFPVFHQAKGGLRICDSNFDNTNNPRLFHYMPETKLAWGDDNTAGTIAHTVNTTIDAGWKTSKLEIEKAATNIANVDTTTYNGLASTTNAARIIRHTTPLTAANNINKGEHCNGVVWRWYGNTTEGEFQHLIDGDEHRALAFGHSWIYDGYQEGPVAPLVGYNGLVTGNEHEHIWFDFVSAAAASSESIEVDCCINMVDVAAYNPRISGCKLYIIGAHPVGGTTDGNEVDGGFGGAFYDDPLFLAEVDFTKGIRSHDADFVEFNGSSYAQGWRESQQDGDGSGTNWALTKEIIISNYPNLSFRMLAGYDNETSSVFAKYRTSCVVDGRVYIGNIEQDVQGAGTAEIFEDRVLVSAVGITGPMPDVFPSTRILEITSNDGDHIIKLEAFKEKIVQLNREKAVVINVYGPGDLETVESTWPQCGIVNPGAATSFEGGIVWANNNGLWLYNGEGVVNLILGKIDNQEWRTFIEIGNGINCLVGYCDVDKTIVVYNGSVSGGIDSYIYNVLVESFVPTTNLISDGVQGILSNFTSSNGKIRYLFSQLARNSETFVMTNHSSIWVEGQFATGLVAKFNNSWTEDDPIQFRLYVNQGTTTDDWKVAGDLLNIANGGPDLPNDPFQFGDVEFSENQGNAIMIATSINNLADDEGDIRYNAQATQVSTWGDAWPDLWNVTIIARVEGTASNALMGSEFDTGEYTPTATAVKYDNAAGDDTTFEGNLGLSLQYAVDWNSETETYDTLGENEFMQFIPPHGGVDPVEDIYVFEVDRGGATDTGVKYEFSFKVRDWNDNIQKNIAIITTTTGSIETDEEIIDDIISQLQSSELGLESYIDIVRCDDSEGTVNSTGDSDYDFFKITTKSANATHSRNQYYKLTDIVTNIPTQDINIAEYVPSIPNAVIPSWSIKTKDMDFGAPGVRKKVYKVYITYRCTGASGVTVTYNTDQNPVGGFFQEGQNYVSTESKKGTSKNTDVYLDNTNGYSAVAELKPLESINNIYSFQLVFNGTNTPKDFEINDITIILRSKSVK